MNTYVKVGLAGVGAWILLNLATKAAEPPFPATAAGPGTKPNEPPKPVPKKPGEPTSTPTPSQPTPAPVKQTYMKKLTPNGQALLFRMFDDHDAISSVARPNLLGVDPIPTDPGMGRLNGTIALKLSQNPKHSALVLTSQNGSLIWIASPDEVVAEALKPDNEWACYLESAAEYDAVKDASYKVDASQIPSDVATQFAKALSAVRAKNERPWYVPWYAWGTIDEAQRSV